MTRLVNLPGSYMVYKSAAWVRDIVYPPNCLLCGDAGHAGMDLCQPCYAELPWNVSACKQCGLPLPDSAGPRCGQCLHDPPPFEQGCAALRYADSSAWLIAGLKFRQQLGYARLLAALLAAYIAQTGVQAPDRLLPVPLHRSRLRKRGYNQAVEIARPLARQLQLPLDIRSVRRIRATPPQAELGLKERHKNIRGAFACHTRLQGEHVAILDDVATSTTTARELAGVLRRAGAGRISLWCVARAPAPGSR